jgi:hypothetical protein
MKDASKLQPHGTYAAYRREHILRGLPPCGPCSAAQRAYDAARRAYHRARRQAA